MSISAAEVKALRERTGAGMMECKKALVETDGDIEAAIEAMRKSGLAKADKKAGRTAAEGRIALAVEGNSAVLVEVNCETDFVAGGDDFAAFADSVAQVTLKEGPKDVETLSAFELDDGETIDTRRRELVAKIGENINVRRFERINSEGTLGRYVHGVRIGVLVDLEGGDEELAKDVAMHIAASNPVCVGPEDVPAEVLDKEREIHRAQAEQSGKPADIVEKMIEGRLRKYVNEIALTGQPFVKNPDQSVGALLKEHGARVLRFVRFEVGEGIEKDETDFASEVMAQVQGR
ncbi:MAG TPA: translation elongation factor Ts [Gammaproteobacteria bacterium]|nr:translation elongation factor Ts [Gammaproteobacteria bacterium]